MNMSDLASEDRLSFSFLTEEQNTNINYNISQFNKLYHAMTQDAKRLYNRLARHLVETVNTELLDKFGTLKSEIANRKLYVMYEDILYCNPKTDHLEPKSTLPVFIEYISQAEEGLRRSFFYSAITDFQEFIMQVLTDEARARAFTEECLDAERFCSTQNKLLASHLKQELQHKLDQYARLTRSALLGRAVAREQEHQQVQKRVYRPDWSQSAAAGGGHYDGDAGRNGQHIADALQHLEADTLKRQNEEFYRLQDQLYRLNLLLQQLLHGDSVYQELLDAKRRHLDDVRLLSSIIARQQEEIDGQGVVGRGGARDMRLRQKPGMRAGTTEDDDDGSLPPFGERGKGPGGQMSLRKLHGEKTQTGARGFSDGSFSREKACQTGEFGIVDNNLDLARALAKNGADAVEQGHRNTINQLNEELAKYTSEVERQREENGKLSAQYAEQCGRVAALTQERLKYHILYEFYHNEFYNLLGRFNREFSQNNQLALPLTNFFNMESEFFKHLNQINGTCDEEASIHEISFGKLQSGWEAEMQAQTSALEEHLSAANIDREDKNEILGYIGQNPSSVYLDSLVDKLNACFSGNIRSYGEKLKQLSEIKDSVDILSRCDKCVQVQSYNHESGIGELAQSYYDVMDAARSQAYEDAAAYSRVLNGGGRPGAEARAGEREMDLSLRPTDLVVSKKQEVGRLLSTAERIVRDTKRMRGRYEPMAATMTISYFEDELLQSIKTVCINFYDDLEGMAPVMIDSELARQRQQIRPRTQLGAASGRVSVRSRVGRRLGTENMRLLSTSHPGRR